MAENYPGNVRREVAFRRDNTEGYSDVNLVALNERLAFVLDDLEPYSDDWYEAAKRFHDYMNSEDFD